KDMTEAERMDVEVQRIKKRMMEINDKIENYNKTNEMIDNLEKNVGELERKVNY
ncbi:FAD-I family protein, partial [Fusobacterium polymorphum]